MNTNELAKRLKPDTELTISFILNGVNYFGKVKSVEHIINGYDNDITLINLDTDSIDGGY